MFQQKLLPSSVIQYKAMELEFIIGYCSLGLKKKPFNVFSQLFALDNVFDLLDLVKSKKLYLAQVKIVNNAITVVRRRNARKGIVDGGTHPFHFSCPCLGLPSLDRPLFGFQVSSGCFIFGNCPKTLFMELVDATFFAIPSRSLFALSCISSIFYDYVATR